MHGFCEVKLNFYALIISFIGNIVNTINKLLFLSELYLALKINKLSYINILKGFISGYKELVYIFKAQAVVNTVFISFLNWHRCVKKYCRAFYQ